jgi:hypothetical protein
MKNETSTNEETKAFHSRHPMPQMEGVDSLFRFSGISTQPVEYIEALLIDGRLYHPKPSQFNDPFECKPHFNWPQKAQSVREIRLHLIRSFRERGHSRKEAEKLVSIFMKKPGYVDETIYKSIQKTFSNLRLCSFTTSNANLLFWSHYADSHRGFCLEYDATVKPINFAFKVTYEKQYPEIIYPTPSGARTLEPALIKSKVWEYEEEYRTFIVPEATNPCRNDGEALLLSGHEITNLYFGANVSPDDKQLVLGILSRGPFNPRVWQANLSKSSYSLEFSLES